MPAKKSAAKAEEKAEKKAAGSAKTVKKTAGKAADNKSSVKKTAAKTTKKPAKAAAKTAAKKAEEKPLQISHEEQKSIAMIAKEASDGAGVFEGIEDIQKEETKPAAKADKKTAAKKAAAKKEKSPAKTAVKKETAVKSSESTAKAIDTIAKEAEDGAEVNEDIEAINAAGQTAKEHDDSLSMIRKQGAAGAAVVKDLADVQKVNDEAEAAAAKAAEPKTADQMTAPGQSQSDHDDAVEDLRKQGSKGAGIVDDLRQVQKVNKEAEAAAAKASEKGSILNKTAPGQNHADKNAALSDIQQEARSGAKIVSSLIKEDPETAAKDKADKKAAADRDAKAVKAGKASSSKDISKDGMPVGAKSAPGQSDADKEEALKMIRTQGASGAKIVKSLAEDKKDTQTKAEETARIDTIAKEADDGAAVYESIEEIQEKETAGKTKPAAKKAVKAEAKPAAKPAAKAAAKAEAKPAEKQTKAEETARIDTIAKEAADGAEVFDTIEEIQKQETAEKPARNTADTAKADDNKADVKAETEQTKKSGLPTMTDEMITYYEKFSPETLLEMVNAMGYPGTMETIKSDLAAADDLEEFTLKTVLNDLPKANEFNMEDDGFDRNALPVLFARVSETLPFKASDQKTFAEKIKTDTARTLINEGIHDSAVYKDLMEDVKQVLMYAQKNGITTLEEMKTKIPADLDALIGHFMDVAATILPGWQYNDVKYYEGFIYGVLSQFEDMSNWHNRAMMDVADLYIKHGDYGQGDADYNYVIRENNLKDQIYYRFANVYRPIDLQKAKSIANDAMQYVDGRFEYYPKLIEILNS